MKWLKNGTPVKLVAFFVIAVILTCTVAFAAGDWQSFVNTDPDDNSGNVDGEGDSTNDEADNNTDGSNAGNSAPDNINDSTDTGDDPTVNVVPEYLHYITGLEIDSTLAFKKAVCAVFDSKSPLYGLSSSILTIELPTEGGESRYIGFFDDIASLPKLGSIASTRHYMTNFSANFCGILLANGNDDKFQYGNTQVIGGAMLDISKNSGYSFTEFAGYEYTDGNLIDALMKNSGANPTMTETVTLPYDFVGYFDDLAAFSEIANKVIVPESGNDSTELTYSSELKRYILSKNSANVTDLSSSRLCTYDNAFILYADATTQETADYTQTVYDTAGGGTGYYFTGGTYVKILWGQDENGNLTFTDENGVKLCINRGITYIKFVKASSSAQTIIK